MKKTFLSAQAFILSVLLGFFQTAKANDWFSEINASNEVTLLEYIG